MKQAYSLLMAVMMLFAVNTVYSQSVQYLSPQPNSEFNSCQSKILIRFDSEIDRRSVRDDLLMLSGDKSGTIQGSFVFSDDGKTLIFTPSKSFQPSETIKVVFKEGAITIFGEPCSQAQFSFKTSALCDALDYSFNEKDELVFARDNGKKSSSMLADTLPADYMPYTVQTVNNPDSGYIFVANMIPVKTTFGTYLSILDPSGNPYKYQKVASTGSDFTVAPNGQYIYTNGNTAYICDNNFNLIDSVTAQNGYKLDIHEFLVLPNGHYIVMSYDPQYIDMSLYVKNGIPNAKVTGCIIQELDRNKNLVFQWRTWDHFKFTDSYQSLTSANVDLFHMNCVTYDTDGNLIASFRHASEVTKINRTTGDIIWRLGGKNNQFNFIGENAANAPTYFSYQHDARRIANGNLTLYDNGNQHKPAFSRGVEYKLDESAKTATLVWEFRHDSDIYSSFMGSCQRLPNGNTLICWGGGAQSGQALITEVHPDKSVALDIYVPANCSAYRAHKFYLPACPLYASVTVVDVLQGNNYDFNKTGKITGVDITFNEINALSYASFNIKKYECPPVNPVFDTVPKVVYPYHLTTTSINIDSYKGEFNIDLSKYPAVIDPENTSVYCSDNNKVFHRVNTTYSKTTGKLTYNSSITGDVLFGIPPDKSVPATTLLVSPVDSAVLNVNRRNNFKWTYPNEFSEAEVQIATDKNFGSIVLDTILKSTDNFNLAPVLPANTYFWTVRTKAGADFSAWASSRSFTLTAPYLKVISPNGGEVYHKDSSINYIRWKHNLPDSFRVELFRNGVLDTLIRDSLFSVTGAVIWKVPVVIPDDSTYTVKVSSISNSSMFDFSDADFTITSKPNDVLENSTVADIFGISAEPNPFETITEIGFEIYTPGVTNVSIFDRVGHKIATILNDFLDAGKYKVRWQPQNVASDMYICRITSAGKSSEIKLILTK